MGSNHSLILFMITVDIRTLHTMTEINECTEGTHLCSQLCINTNGSYICDCGSGFIIDVDRRTCDGKVIDHLKYACSI